MVDKHLKVAALAATLLGATAFATTGAVAAPRHHATHRHHVAVRGGMHRLVSDGPGTSFGFHHDPLPFVVGAWRRRYRQANAVHQAVIDDALTSGGYYGFPGDSVYGEGDYAAYGVFNGADGYGSPYFAGFYGPAGGTDYGPFGRAYDE